MNEKDWLILKTLSEKKSITKTAQSLFISQPALSSRLQQIEARFGTAIVVRSKKGVQFTPEGEYLVKGACDILKRIQVLEENIQNMQETMTGTLRIGTSHFFTKHMLPDLLASFKAQHPGIEFKVTTNWSREIISLIQNNEVQIGFIRGDYDWTGEKELLFKEKMYISFKNEFSLTDLPYMPRIDFHNEYSTQLLLDKWWNEHFSIPPRIGMEVDKVDTCKEMVSRGLGYAFLPATIFNENDKLCNYEIVYKSGQSLMRKTWMFYQKESTDLKLVKAFLDFIRSNKFD